MNNHNFQSGFQKTALVTGSSSELGREIVENLIANGYEVFGVSLEGFSLEHDSYNDVLCDLSDESAVEELFEIVSEKNRGIRSSSPPCWSFSNGSISRSFFR